MLLSVLSSGFYESADFRPELIFYEIQSQLEAVMEAMAKAGFAPRRAVVTQKHKLLSKHKPHSCGGNDGF